jgi:caffeoyl-CoA O-methyltransferase
VETTITSYLANQYAEKFSSPEDVVAHRLNTYTQNHVRGAHMISGHLQGNFLKMLSMIINPQYVIELGTYTGYATIALATGLQQSGQIHTIDTDASIQDIREQHWTAAGLKNKITQHIGKALDVLPNLKNIPFDLAFIDADKGNYIQYLNTLLEIMPINATIVIDNTLFHGEVFQENISNKSAVKIHEFNTYLQQLPNVFHVLLPIRDGITMVRKTA